MLLRASAMRYLAVAVVLLSPAAAMAQATAQSDAEVESCLTDGEILKGRERLVGVTKPVKIDIDCDGGERSAVFKFVDEHRRGSTRLAGGKVEFNFSDSYLYERAAYLLDREIGLDMVPVAVLRSYKGDSGVLVDWIPDTVHENAVSSPLSGPQTASLYRQKTRMHLFDSLIFNTDRRAENILIDESTARLYLIDHSRAFRETKELRDEFAGGRVWLSRETYDKLAGLDEAHLAELLDGLISKNQLKALLERRDLIVAKIDRDVGEHGEESVFRGD